MSYAKVIESVSKTTGVPPSQVRTVIDEFFAQVAFFTVFGQRFAVPGVGVFKLVIRAARAVRDIASHERRIIPATPEIRFKHAKNGVFRKQLANQATEHAVTRSTP